MLLQQHHRYRPDPAYYGLDLIYVRACDTSMACMYVLPGGEPYIDYHKCLTKSDIFTIVVHRSKEERSGYIEYMHWKR